MSTSSVFAPRRVHLAAIVSFTVAIGLTGCSSGPMPSPSASPSASAMPSYVDTYVEPDATEIAPLRGTTVPAGTTLGPALSAKVDNHPSARPQFGLEHTDIVYEELVEGGMTRYVAIWQSTVPEVIGPVRSIRPMDPDIISPYRGIVAYSGGQYQFVQLMRRTPVVNAIHGQANTKHTFYRVKGRPGPHDVGVRALQVIEDFGPLDAPRQNWSYALTTDASSAAKEGTPAPVVRYRFSSLMWGVWSYDPATERYYRSQANRGPDLDSAGNQLNTANIVVLRVAVKNRSTIPTTILNTTGEAWVATGGRVIHGSFTKASRNEPIYLYDDNGFTIQLAAGNTWVELIPTTGSVSFE